MLCHEGFDGVDGSGRAGVGPGFAGLVTGFVEAPPDGFVAPPPDGFVAMDVGFDGLAAVEGLLVVVLGRAALPLDGEALLPAPLVLCEGAAEVLRGAAEAAASKDSSAKSKNSISISRRVGCSRRRHYGSPRESPSVR